MKRSIIDLYISKEAPKFKTAKTVVVGLAYPIIYQAIKVLTQFIQ